MSGKEERKNVSRESKEPSAKAEKRDEAWANRNGPLFMGLGAFLLMALMAVVMKMCD